MDEKSHQLPRVVVIGAGFAGLNAAKVLAKRQAPLVATIVDRHNYHLFQPLLYQVATAGLSPADIATPVRSILSQAPHTDVLMAGVSRVDCHAKKVVLDDGDALAYDYLIIAAGATHSYFTHPEWEPLAPGLKTVDDATEIRRRVLLAFERAERTHDEQERKALLTFVIVGGGPTGIELAGAIAELRLYALARDFKHIEPKSAQIILIEAGARLLPTFPQRISEKAKVPLEKLGVKLLLGKRVTKITEQGVSFDQEFIPANTVIWAAGVQPSPLAKDLGVPLDRAGRVLVQPDLSVPGHPEIFVVGDLAAVKWQGEAMVPGMAPGAMQEGKHAAENIVRLIKGQPTHPFHYFHKGSMATIGRRSAVVALGKMQIAGFLAWLTWLFVHLVYLIGFRNRIAVLFNWAWSYLFYRRGMRLITDAKKTKSAAQLSAATQRPAAT